MSSPRRSTISGEKGVRVLFVAQELSYEPQGIMSMAAVLKQAGHQVALTVADLEDPVQFAVDYQPAILGYSVMTGSQRGYFALNRRIRAALDPLYASQGKPPVFSAFGGPHPTFFPEMISEPGVDGVCIGEGEGAIVDLADALAADSFRPDIRNWWFKVVDVGGRPRYVSGLGMDNGYEIVKNPVRPLIQDLSALPHGDRALIYDKHPSLAASRIKHFMSSRGCPYNCTYCFNHAYYEIYKGARRGYQRTVDDVIAEVNEVRARWPLEQVVFLDDLFIIHTEWLEELADKWPKQVGLPFFCNVRANLLVKDPRKVTLLKRAGCHTVSMGIETANDRIRVELLRRRMSREEIIQAGRMVRAAGMHITGSNILGLPTSTLEDDLATMRLNAEAQISYAYALLFQPYPGTELGRFTQEQGLLAGSFDDIGEIAWDHTILAFEESDKRQREHLQRLFALGVEWPWLEPLIRRLIRLPHNRLVDGLLWWLHKLHKGYAIYTRVHPIKAGPLELFRIARHFMRIKS
jgi:anaerobic magnesium-protoporphyrin IX monomethyl ester cyclase